LIINTVLELEPQQKVLVAGKEYGELPKDLFIPPDALQVLLESFSGPLDLLLYLIRKQNIHILDIPVSSITKQYLRYIELMASRKLELAADYLVMAATLAEIKSRMLLPIQPLDEEAEEEDPRMVLVRRLQTYAAIQQAALDLDSLPRQDRDTFSAKAVLLDSIVNKSHPAVLIADVQMAMHNVLQRADRLTHHSITRESLSVQDRMQGILLQLQGSRLLEFTQLFQSVEGRLGLVVSLLAVLELARLSLVVITQAQAFSSLYIEVT
jgi:segregation and condensation protein A